MKKSYFFTVAALFCCMMNVQLSAQSTVLYEYDGIHYVLVERTYADVTTRSAYVVHPETSLEEEHVSPSPSSYTGAIVIPDTIRYEGAGFPVKFINDSAFHQSTVTSIDLPATITVFNAGSFKDCLALQTIICRAKTPPSTRIYSIPWNYEEVFGSLDPEQVAVVVPENSILDYQDAGGWSTFTHFYPIGSPQAIDEINDQPQITNHKWIKDGQLIILRDGKTFNALGVELNSDF